jgi:ABC-type uncharacterized transport system YnjBCD ATPase subunit
MNFSKTFLAIAGSCLLITMGCETRMADCTIASTKNVRLSKMDIDSLPRAKGIVGISTQTTFLFIPLTGPANVKDALDDALAKGNGDLMVDAVFYQGGWWFIVGQNWISVKGEVVKTRTGE